MKTTPGFGSRHLFRLIFLAFALVLLATPAARAGLSLEMNVIRYDQYGYYFYPNLTTNTTAPAVPFGDYFITSFGYPTNGWSTLYHYDANGFNQNNSGGYGYGDFNGMMHELTNGTWSVFVTNAVTTNVYHFTVTANIVSNDLPYVSITFPADGAVNVSDQPTFTWQGPTNYSDLVVYGYNFGIGLPVTQTSLASPNVLYQGLNSVTVHYDSNSTTAVVSSVPLNNASQPISSWISTAHLQDYSTAQFTVGAADTSGTSHVLVAHYAWDSTNGDGTASGADTSGNGYDMNFGGGQGGQGGVNSTADPAAGPRAIQFHDGDGNSAGYVGWNPTPAGLLTALSGSFSVSCWIKTTQNNFGGDQDPAYYGAGIIAADNGGQANDVVPLALTGSKIGFGTGGDSDVTLNSSASVNDGNYHHVVVTRNQQTGQKIIYIDGVLDSFSSGTKNLLNDPQKLTLGALADAGDPDASDGGYYNGYDGELDDVQIYSGVLSAGDVAGLFANPGSTVANGGGTSGGHRNVAHYTFEDGSSTFQLGVDSSTNGNNLVTYSYWGQIHTNSATAAAGTNAVQFFGTSSMVCYDQVLTNLNAVLAGSFTFSTWVKTTASRGNDSDNAYYGNTIFWAFNDQGNTNDTIPLAITGSKAAFTTRGGDSGAFDNLHSLTSVNDGNYHLITVTRDGATGEKKIYVDGNFEASQFGTANPLNGNNYYLSVGGTTSSSYTGLLDDLQIYSGVLSDAEVASLYNHPGVTVADVAGTGGGFATALNTTNLAWSTGGNLPWFTETTVTHDGLAAQSGPVTNSQSSYLQTTVPAGGQISFYWKASSENGFDFLTFYINGSEQDAISGNADWNQESYSVSAGDVLRWEYNKDSSDSDGLDAGFLDQVSYAVTPPIINIAPIITVNPFSQTNSPGYTVALYAAATSNPTATWQWFKVGSGLITNATSALYLPTNSGTAGVAGSYYAVASNFLGSATTLTAVVTFASATLPPDWSLAFKTQMYNNTSDITTNYNIACLVDATGTNIYTVGSVQGTNSFGPDTLISRNGSFGSTILKQTTAGTPIWGRAMTNNGNGSSYAQSVVPAPGNGIYVSGVINGTNWLGTNQLVDIGGGSSYLARFDANGSNLWVRLITGTNFNFTTYHMLASDPAGNVTLSVLIYGNTSFGTTNLYAEGQRGALVQYDANGNVRWLQLPSNWPNYLTYDAGRIYGCMGGSDVSYIGGYTNVSDRNLTLFSLNATNGQGVWVKGFGAAQGQNSATGFGDNNALVAVSGTNLFLAGSEYGSNAVFGPITIALPAGVRGQYLARYDTNGNAQIATSFGSPYTWLWAVKADAAGNVYVGGDFDTYSVFGNNVIAAPFYDTIQSVNGIENRIPGQTFVAKFDRNGNPLWARPAQSPSSYVNSRDIALAADGVWSCGFFNPTGTFGTNTVYGGITVFGFPFGTLEYHSSGYLAKISDRVAVGLLPVTLLNPQNNGTNFQFQFVSQAGFTNAVQYKTNLVLGNWLTYSNVTGDGTLKTIPIPLSVFNPARQGFVRVSTQ